MALAVNRRTRPMCPIAWTMALAVGGLGCHAARGDASTSAVTPGGLPLAGVSAGEDWVVASVVADRGGSFNSPAEFDGTRSVTNGAFRLVVHRESIEVAPHLLSSPIASAAALGGNWYLVTRDGNIFRAPSFLARPVDTGLTVGKDATGIAIGRGLLLLTDWNRGVWSFAGDKLRPAKSPGKVTAIADDPEGAPLAQVCQRWYRLDATGTFVASESAPDQDKRQYGSDDLSSAASERLQARVEATLKPLRHSAAGSLRELENLIRAPGGKFIRPSQIFTERAECEVLAAGAETIARCGSEASPPDNVSGDQTQAGIAFRFGAGGHPEPWLNVSAKGTALAGPGPSLLTYDSERVFWSHLGRRDVFDRARLGWHECPSPDTPSGSPIIGLSGSWLLMSRLCGEQESFELVDLNSATGSNPAVIRPLAEFVPSGLAIRDAVLSADGSTLFVMLQGPNGPVLARGEMGNPLPQTPLPAGTESVAFVDAFRGMAVGLHLGQVWGTIDGGARWSPLLSPLEGDLAAVPLTDPPLCNLVACWSGQAVVWANRGALQEAGFRQPAIVAPGRAPTDRNHAHLELRRKMVVIAIGGGMKDRDGCPDEPSERLLHQGIK